VQYGQPPHAGRKVAHFPRRLRLCGSPPRAGRPQDRRRSEQESQVHPRARGGGRTWPLYLITIRVVGFTPAGGEDGGKSRLWADVFGRRIKSGHPGAGNSWCPGRTCCGFRAATPAHGEDSSTRHAHSAIRAVHPPRGGESAPGSGFLVLLAGSPPRAGRTVRTAHGAEPTNRVTPARGEDGHDPSRPDRDVTIHPRDGEGTQTAKF
jgi:hypothetical protein